MRLNLNRWILICSTLVFSYEAGAALIPVDTGMLAEAASRAEYGDTLVLSPGRHAGHVRLAAGVSLDGQGAMIDAGANTGPALILEGTNIVQNVTVHGWDESDVGIRVIRGPVSFQRVHVRGFRKYGIRAGGGEGSFSDGSVQDCGGDGLSAAGGKWTIKNSRFANNGDDGIDLFRSNSSLIVSCVFDSNKDAAVELAISRDVRLIGNASGGHRVTCAARLGDLPSRFSNNRLADGIFLERRGDTPVTDWTELERLTDKTNIRITNAETEALTAVPVEITTAPPPATSPAPADAPAPINAGLEFTNRIKSSASANLPYAGLQMSDVSMKGQLGSDTNITPILRSVLDDPFSLGAWLAARSADGGSSFSARYRQYASDLGVSWAWQTDTPGFETSNPKQFAGSVLKIWGAVHETYEKTFEAMDSAARRRLLNDLEAQYAEEPELGLPLVEDFHFDVELDRRQRNLMSRAAQVDSAALMGSGEMFLSFLEAVPPGIAALRQTLSDKQAAQDIVYRQETPWGPLVIAGTGNNRHDSVVGFLFDLGGDDEYSALGGDAHTVIVDMGGNDVYGGAFSAGVGRLSGVWDGGGDDLYESSSRTQGCGLLGIGILHDMSGADKYIAGRYSQGFGFFGAGWLRDGGGDDIYRIPGYGQGFGGVRGLGVVDDAGGNDRYEILPINNDPIRDPSRTTSMGQGIGDGLRPNGAGGIGILWDGGGRDEYLADLFAQGIGYWYGFGALIDIGGANDLYQAYHYVQGAGVHLSVGALYDDGGADRYHAWYVAQGCGHDVSVGALYDVSGNDIYSAYGLSQGAGSTNGFGLLCDGGGRDAYMGVARPSGQGDAWYQARLREYGSAGILIDLGGDDYYASGALNRGVWFKGDHGLGVDE